MRETINNYELRRPVKLNKEGFMIRNSEKRRWIILMHYPNGKHFMFTTEETERQLLKRVKSICFDARDKISYLNVYLFYKNTFDFEHYGEFTYRSK